jgi:hypothetical protein
MWVMHIVVSCDVNREWRHFRGRSDDQAARRLCGTCYKKYGHNKQRKYKDNNGISWKTSSGCVCEIMKFEYIDENSGKKQIKKLTC